MWWAGVAWRGGDFEVAVVDEAVGVEALGEIGKLQTVGRRSPRPANLLHGDHDPQDALRLEALDRLLEDRARPDPVLAPEQDRVEGLLDARQGPRLHEDRFLAFSARGAEKVSERRRDIYQEQTAGLGEVEPRGELRRIFQGGPAHRAGFRIPSQTGTGFALLHDRERGKIMLWTIFVILLILWLLGFSVWHLGALIHLLLVAAVIVLIIRLLQGRPV